MLTHRRLIRVLGLLCTATLGSCTFAPAASTSPTATEPAKAMPAATGTATMLPPVTSSTETAVDLLNGRWEPRTAMRPARSEMPAAILDGLIYVPGGFGATTTFAAYDPAGDSWRDLAPLPEGSHHLMATAHGDKIYVFGGAREAFTATTTAWVYDPVANRWEDLAPLPEPRMSGAAVTLGDFIYLAGGVGVESGEGATLLRYDSSADTWARLAKLTNMREHIAAVVLSGRILHWVGDGTPRS